MKFRTFINSCQNRALSLHLLLATELAILLRGEREATVEYAKGMSLHSPAGARKYLSVAERRRFLDAAHRAPVKVRLFCLMLVQGGGRISETLALVPAAIDLESGVVNYVTLKRRSRGIIRQVPVQLSVLRALDRAFGIREKQRDPVLRLRPLWTCSRATGWRHVKAVMAAAGIVGTAAMPKGLRHTFGVSAFQARVPPHLVQRWLGHASLRTTAIYGDVIGREERAFAARMWRLY
jgi:integrase